MDDFEALLGECKNALERFIYYRVENRFDAEDIFQETCFTASEKFSTIRDQSLFKAWIISIARNKCSDYFRARAGIVKNGSAKSTRKNSFSLCQALRVRG